VGRIVGATCVLAALLAAAPASAQSEGTDLFPWPQALPPSEGPTDAQGRPVEHCRRVSVECVNALRRRLRRQFERFDASCDHRVVIAYSYLQITRGLLADMRGRGRAWCATGVGWRT
jgi:hypothetical protein